jgi:transcription elongation factor GreA
MAVPKQTLLTAEGKVQLEAMLPTLVAQKREIKERLQGTKTYGDAADGGEGTEAKEELARLDRKINEIEHTLRQATIIDTSQHDGTVQIGSRVTIVDAEGEAETWTIVLPAEASTRNRKISDQSPMGAAMIGKIIGDEIRVHAPGGDTVYTIRTIE